MICSSCKEDLVTWIRPILDSNAKELHAEYLKKYKHINNAVHYIQYLVKKTPTDVQKQIVYKNLNDLFDDRNEWKKVEDAFSWRAYHEITSYLKTKFGDTEEYALFTEKYLRIHDHKIGQELTDFTFEDFHGNMLDITGFEGRNIVIFYRIGDCIANCLVQQEKFIDMANKYQKDDEYIFIILMHGNEDLNWKLVLNLNKPAMSNVIFGGFNEKQQYQNFRKNIYYWHRSPRTLLINSDLKIKSSYGPKADEKLFEKLLLPE